jgi:hypothetical protein
LVVYASRSKRRATRIWRIADWRVSKVVPDPNLEETSAKDDESDLPEGTALRVYLYLLRQSNPVGLSEIRIGAGLSTSSLASYHLDRLVAAGLAKREGGGYLADRMALKGFVRVRTHIVSTSLFMVGFFATALILLMFEPWQTRYQQFVLSVFVIVVALLYSLTRALQSVKWLKARTGLGKQSRHGSLISLRKKSE